MGDGGGQDDVGGHTGHLPVAPQHRLDQGVEVRGPGVLEHQAQQLQGGRPLLVVQGDPGHQLDPRPTVLRGPVHAGHQTVVELEGEPGQSGAVEGEVGPLVGPDGAGPGQVGQRLDGGQDAVTVRQGLLQRRHVVGVPLDGQHAPGPVVSRQDQSRKAERPVLGRRPGHANPDRSKMILATAEKSSRP